MAICEEIGNNTWTFEVETKSPFGYTILRYWGEAEMLVGA